MAFKIDEFRTHYSRYNEFAKADKFDVLINSPSALKNSPFGSSQLALQCEVAELPGRNVSMIEYRHYGFTERIPHHNSYGDITLGFYCNGNLTEKKFFDLWMDSMVPQESGLVNYTKQGSENLYSTEIRIRQYSASLLPDNIDEVEVTDKRTLGDKFRSALVREGDRIVNAAFDKYLAPVGAFYDNSNLKSKTRIIDKLPAVIKPIYEVVLVDAVPVSVAPLSLNWQDDSIHRLQVTFAFKKWYVPELGQSQMTPTNEITGNMNGLDNPRDKRFSEVKDRIENNIVNGAVKGLSSRIKF